MASVNSQSPSSLSRRPSYPNSSNSAPVSSRASPSPRLRRLDSLASFTPLQSPSPPLASSPSAPTSTSHPQPSAAGGRRHSQPYTSGLGLSLQAHSASSSPSSFASFGAPSDPSKASLEDHRTRHSRSNSSTLTPVHSFSFHPPSSLASPPPEPVQGRQLHASPSATSLALAQPAYTFPPSPAPSPPASWVPPPLRPSASASSPLNPTQSLSSSSSTPAQPLATSSPPSHYSFGFTPTVPHAPNSVRPVKPRSRTSSSVSLSSQGRRTTRGTTPPSTSILLPSLSPPTTFNANLPSGFGSPPGPLSQLAPQSSPRPQPLSHAHAIHQQQQQYLQQQQQHYSPPPQPHQSTYASPVTRTSSLPSIYSHPAFSLSPVSLPPAQRALPHMDPTTAATVAHLHATDPLGLHDQEIPDEAPPSYAPPLASSTSHPSLGVLHPFYSQPEHAPPVVAHHHHHHAEHDLHAHARHASEGRHGSYGNLGSTLSSSSSSLSLASGPSAPRPLIGRARSFDAGYSDASETEGERGGLRFTTSSSSGGSRWRNRPDLAGGGRVRLGGGLSSSSSGLGSAGSGTASGNSALGLVGLGRQGADGLGRGDSGLRSRRPVLDTAESGLDINVLSTDGEEPLPTSLLRPPPRPPSRLFQLLESLPLIMLLRLLSVVPATVGTAYLLGRALGSVGVEGGADGGREDGSRRECVLAIFWTLLTGMQCFLLTSGLTRRWLAYYSLPSTLLRLLSLQTICWPMTSLTLKFVGPSRPLIGWVVIGTTTSLSNTVRIWVTSNIATYARAAGGTSGARGHRGTLREALSVANEDIRYASRSLLSIVIGGSGEVVDEVDGATGGGSAPGASGTCQGGRQGKTLTKGVVRTKRRMDWRSVIRQVVWPCLFGYWLTGWFLLLERDAYRRQDGRAAALGH